MTREEFSNLGVGKPFALGCRKFKVIKSDEESACDECFLTNLQIGIVMNYKIII